jgi:hypothetical protein
MYIYDYYFIRNKDNSNLCYMVRKGYCDEKICNQSLYNHYIKTNNFTCPSFTKNRKIEKIINKYDNTEYVKSCSLLLNNEELIYYQNINEINLNNSIKNMQNFVISMIIILIVENIF